MPLFRAAMLRYEACVEIRVLRQQGMSLRKIARSTGSSVNTVRKYLADPGQPSYRKRAAVRRKVGPYEEYIEERVRMAAPQWIPARVLWREIAARGFRGTERAVQRFVKELKPAPVAAPVVRFETEPGDQMQLDWIEFRKTRGDLLAAFVATLGWSRASFVRFVDNERLETLLECTRAAFDYFGGVTRTVLADNMKTIVDRRNAFGEGLHRWHPAFLDLSQQYSFQIRLCAPYRAQTKGKVERMNGYLRYSFYVPLAAKLKAVGARPDCQSANAAIGPWLEEVANARVHATTGEVPALRLVRERAHLIGLPRDHQLAPLGKASSAPGSRDKLEGIVRDLPKAAQHPLSVYAELMGVL